MRRQLVVIILLAVSVAAGIVLVRRSHNEQPKAAALPAATGGGEPASHVSFLERLIPPPAAHLSAGPGAPRSLADLAERLPLERAVAQLFLFGFDGKDASAPIFGELKRLDVGGLVLDGRNYDSAQQLASLVERLKSAAAHARHLPPWVMAEQDGGDYSQFADLPPSRPPGGFHDADKAAAAMLDSATTLKALGLNGLLEPDLDVASSDSAIGTQAFSDDPHSVADYARKTIAGCHKLLVFCAAKHFPGIGAADTPTDEGPAQIGLSLNQLISATWSPSPRPSRPASPGSSSARGSTRRTIS